MIPTPHNWKVTFHLINGEKVSHTVFCVKRFAKSFANEALGFPAYYSKKIVVGLQKTS